MYDVVGGTCSCLDHVLIPRDKYPVKNEKTFLESYTTVGGGVSANALTLLSRLGAKAAFFGLAGKDAAGESLRRELADFDVNVSGYTLREEMRTPHSFIIVDPQTGERSILAYQPSFPVKWYEEDKWEALCSPLPTIFLFDTHHISVKKKLGAWAKDHDVPVIWDIGTYKKGIEELFSFMDYFIAPDDFLRGYYQKKEISHEKELAELLRDLHDHGGFSFTAITVGAEGVYALLEDEVVHFPAMPLSRVVDTTGAGDMFHAGFVYGLLQDCQVEQSLAWGIVCAGVSCTYMGGRAENMCPEELKNAYNNFRIHTKRRRVIC